MTQQKNDYVLLSDRKNIKQEKMEVKKKEKENEEFLRADENEEP